MATLTATQIEAIVTGRGERVFLNLSNQAEKDIDRPSEVPVSDPTLPPVQPYLGIDANAVGIGGKSLQMAAPNNNDYIKYDSAQGKWVYVQISGGGGGTWGSITGTLSSQTDLNSAIAAKAPLAPLLPVITVNPLSLTGYEDVTATFSVTAGHILANSLTYQWEKQESGVGAWVAISGATSNSYTTPVLNVSADNGDKYRCVVTNPFGSVTSNQATLTVELLPTMPSGAMGIWYAKDYDATKKAIPNALGGTIPSIITRNHRGVFTSGKVGGEGYVGGWLDIGGMTITEKFAAGRDGVVAATRVVFGSSNTGSVRYRSTFSLPAGTYTMVIDAKSNGSNQDFLMSYNGGSTTSQKTATSTLQQFKYEFTLGSTTTFDGRFLYTLGGVAGDFTIDKAFLWEGNAASVPADLIDAGHMYLGNSSKSTINCTGGELFLSGGETGSIDLPAFITSSETTILAVVKRVTDYTNVAGYRYPFIWDVVDGVTAGFGTSNWSLGEFEAEGGFGASFGGRTLYPAPNGFAPNLFVDGGYHVLSMSGNTSEIDLWFDDVLQAGDYSSGTSKTARKFQVGNSLAAFGLVKFKMNALAIYNRKLTDVERRSAIAALINKAAESSITITKPANLLIGGFDSISAGPSSNSYIQAYLANTTRPRSVFVNESIGGSTLHLNPQAKLNLDIRVANYELDGIPAKSADRAGRKFIITLLAGANDLQPNYSGDVTAFLNALWAITDPLRARGVTLGIATILPKGSSQGGFALHNSARATANTQIRSLLGVKYDFLIDFAADATMGSDAAANNTSLYGDGLHPTATAHSTYLEPIYRAAVNAQLV